MSTIVETTSQLRCRQIMRRPVETVGEDETVVCAARRMRERDVGLLPVVNREGVVCGVVTDRDIALRASTESNSWSLRVSDVMTRSVIGCDVDDDVATVEALMRTHRITRVIILDDRHCPAGIISLSDLAQYESAARVGRIFQAVSTRKYAPERP